MIYDLAIIGGGPAGLSASLYALRANKNVILFEGKSLGGLLNEIAHIENYPAIEGIEGIELARRMSQQVCLLNPKIVKQFVIGVHRKGENFTLFTPTDEYTAKKVIFCTGAKRNDIQAVREFEGSGISYCALCDGFFYKNKTVIVVGSGYTAHEDVKYLAGICKKVYWLGKNNSSERVDLKNVELVVGTSNSINKILGSMVVEGVLLNSGRTIPLNAIFIAMGNSPQTDLFDSVRDSSSNNSYILGKNAYIAGDANSDFKQIVYACALGAYTATQALKE